MSDRSREAAGLPRAHFSHPLLVKRNIKVSVKLCFFRLLNFFFLKKAKKSELFDLIFSAEA
jgi:hypothetical protein